MWSREGVPGRDVTDAHGNHEQRAEKSVRRRRWNSGQTADRADCECEGKSEDQFHMQPPALVVLTADLRLGRQWLHE
jgi:hypothetical protein